MVGELHKRGYQRLRVVPAMSGSGMHWRCHITPVSNVLRTHGAHLAKWDYEGGLIATYTTGAVNEFFEWPDRKTATARELADTFLERFPLLCEAGRGSDWDYAGWFVEMLGLAERGWFPIVYQDGDVDESHGLELTNPDEVPETKPTLPPPPPGEVEDPGWPEQDQSQYREDP